MAVVDVALHWSGATGSKTRKPLSNEYVAIWKLKTDDAADQGQVVASYFAANVVALGDTYAYANDVDGSAWCDSIRAERDPKSAFLWYVTVTYRTPEDEEQEDKNGEFTLNPIEWRPRLQTNTTHYTRTVHKSRYMGGYKGSADGHLGPEGSLHAVQNSAFTPFIPKPERDDSRLLITITRNAATYLDADGWDDWQNVVNDAELTITGFIPPFFKTCAKHTLMVRGFAATMRRTNDIDYWEMSGQLDWKRDTWIDEILDEGIQPRTLPGDPDGKGGTFSLTDLPPDGVPKGRRLVGPDGNPITDPVLFDGDGQPLDVSDPDFEEVYGRWMHYELQDLRAWPILQGVSL